jgi:hypothetical protein
VSVRWVRLIRAEILIHDPRTISIETLAFTALSAPIFATPATLALQLLDKSRASEAAGRQTR